jgi:mono/diheme cytochrome c family protein
LRTSARVALVVLALAAGTACRQDMHDQPKYRPLESSAFFPDGRASRPVVEGTVARGQLGEDAAWTTGRVGKEWVRTAPVPFTAERLARGRERFDIFCSPCHDRVGTGGGMVVQRGFKRPPSFHIDRLRQAGDGYFFETITLGFGTMPSYATQIPVDDRWAIVAYVRALQLSQGATLADVPADERARLQAGKD